MSRKVPWELHKECGPGLLAEFDLQPDPAIRSRAKVLVFKTLGAVRNQVRKWHSDGFPRGAWAVTLVGPALKRWHGCNSYDYRALMVFAATRLSLDVLAHECAHSAFAMTEFRDRFDREEGIAIATGNLVQEADEYLRAGKLYRYSKLPNHCNAA